MSSTPRRRARTASAWGVWAERNAAAIRSPPSARDASTRPPRGDAGGQREQGGGGRWARAIGLERGGEQEEEDVDDRRLAQQRAGTDGGVARREDRHRDP